MYQLFVDCLKVCRIDGVDMALLKTKPTRVYWYTTYIPSGLERSQRAHYQRGMRAIHHITKFSTANKSGW